LVQWLCDNRVDTWLLVSMTEESSTDYQTIILVVEDNRTQAEFLRFILQKSGHRVLMASNGLEALEVIRATRPDLILTDIVMPEMDGYKLCSSIKEDPSYSDIPVILVTHLYDPIDVIRGLESGADNFIIKPYDPDRIHALVSSTLEMESEIQPVCKSPVRVHFSNGQYLITADRRQILNILLSTYEIAVKNYSELQEVHAKINYLNEKLQKTVDELRQSNEDLIAENIERKRVESALAMANNKLQLMASITRHDLLNQLNSLQGYLDLALADRNEEPAQAWTYVEKALGVVLQTIDTVKFTDEYQNIGVKNPVWQNLHDIVINSTRHTSLHHIALENLLPVDTELYADPLIEKVFSNLIENSVRYGGKNTIIRFMVKTLGDDYCIICEDDGVGVSVVEKEKIFSYQYGKNTGLGLFLTREILSITGISIRETGIPGEGARFELICPEGTIRKKSDYSRV